VNRTIREFEGKAGNICITRESDICPFEVWFEDFCILGDGNSELEALNNAWSYTGDIMALISEARLKIINATPAPSGE